MAVEANPSLLRQHAAVILARQAAIKAVRQQRKRQGIRGAGVAPSQSAALRRSIGFAHCAELTTGAQKTEAQKSSTSAVRKS
jgi:hypothetical protein